MAIGKSTTSLVLSDIHFPYQDKKCWKAVKSFIQTNAIKDVYLNGDIFDLEALSTFLKGKDSAPHIVPEMKQGVSEINWIQEHILGHVYFIPGNHEARWDKVLTAAFGPASKDLKLLSFGEQLYAQGMNKKVKYTPESIHNIGCRVGQFVIRHGDKQSSRYGGGNNVAANRIRKTMGSSEIVGHYHVAQMMSQSFDGNTAIAIANPCLTGPHAYATGASWQQGFTILEQASCGWVTPFVVVMHKSKFSYAGKVYCG